MGEGARRAGEGYTSRDNYTTETSKVNITKGSIRSLKYYSFSSSYLPVSGLTVITRIFPFVCVAIP